MLAAMKMKLAVSSAALVFVLVTGCGPSEAEKSAAEAKVKADVEAAEKAAEAKKVIPIIGTYKLDVEDLKRRFLNAIEGEMNSLVKSMYVQLGQAEGSIVLMPNDQFVMNLGGAEILPLSGTWSLKEGKLMMKSEGHSHEATLAKGVITMVVDKTPAGTRNFVLQAPSSGQGKAK
jgi:hypothetical protein